MIRFADNVAPVLTAPMPTASEIRMSNSSSTVGKTSNSQANAACRTAKFLRALYPTATAANVAADSGIPAGRISKWLIGASGPRIDDTIALTLAYGPDFLSAVLPNAPAWLDRCVRAERQAKLEEEQERITRELQALSR